MALNSSGGGGGSSRAIEAGAAFVRLFTNNNQLYRGLSQARQQLNAFGQFTAQWGAKLSAVSGGGLAVLGGILTGAVTKATDIAELADKLGTSTDKISRMGYAFGTAGINLEELTGHFENFAERVAEFRRTGAGEGAAAFQALGIAANDLGQDMADNLLTTFDRLGRIAGGDRIGLLSKLGGDQFQRLNLAFNRLGPQGFRDAMQRSDLIGATVQEQDALRAKRISRAWNDASQAVRNSILGIGESLFKYFGGIDVVSNRIVEVAARVRLWVRENGELVMGVTLGLTALAALGVTLTGLGLTLGAITAAASGFAAAISAVAAAIGPLAIAAGVGAAGGIFAAWLMGTKSAQQAWRDFVDLINETLGPTVQNVQGAFRGIRDSLGRGEIEGAFRIGVAAIQVEWVRLVNYLEKVWLKFKLGLIAAFEQVKIELKFILGQLTAVVEAAGVAAQAVADPFNFGKYKSEIDAILQEPGMVREVSLRSEQSRRAGDKNILADAAAGQQKALEDAQRRLNFLLLQNAFRQAFNNPNNEELKPFAKVGEALAAAATVATRGAQGALASSQVFGMGLVDPQVKKLDEVKQVLIDIRDALGRGPDGINPNKELEKRALEELRKINQKLPIAFGGI